jgi:hypothetical protein
MTSRTTIRSTTLICLTASAGLVIASAQAFAQHRGISLPRGGGHGGIGGGGFGRSSGGGFGRSVGGGCGGNTHFGGGGGNHTSGGNGHFGGGSNHIIGGGNLQGGTRFGGGFQHGGQSRQGQVPTWQHTTPGAIHGQSSIPQHVQPAYPQQQHRTFIPEQHAGAIPHQSQGNGFTQQSQPALAQRRLPQNSPGAQVRSNTARPLSTVRSGLPTHGNTVPGNSNRVAANRTHPNSVIAGNSQRGEHMTMKPQGMSSARNQALLTKMRGSNGATASRLPHNDKGTVAKRTGESRRTDTSVIHASNTGKGRGSTATGRGTKVANGTARNSGKASSSSAANNTPAKKSNGGATGKNDKGKTAVAGSSGKPKGAQTPVASTSGKKNGSTAGKNNKGGQTGKGNSKKPGDPGVDNPKGQAVADLLAGLLGGLSDADSGGAAGGSEGDGSEVASSESMASGDSGSEIVALGDSEAEGESDDLPVESPSASSPTVVVTNQLVAQTGSISANPAVSLVVPETAPAAASPEVSVSRLILINPKDSPGRVSYVLEGAANVLDPDGASSTDGAGPWLVEFDRGVAGEQARYSLTVGTYTFTMTTQGWELYNTTGASSTLPSSSPASASDAVTQDAAAMQRLLVVNPKDSGGTVSYLIDGTAYTLAEGESNDFSIPARCLVEFDRGVDGAEARYTLQEGTYTFTQTKQGWELYNTQFEVTLDNAANEGDFYYVRDGNEESVAAGATRKLTDKFPPRLSFDRGDGGAAAERTLDSNGVTYRIAVRKDSNLLDLIPSSVQ